MPIGGGGHSTDQSEERPACWTVNGIGGMGVPVPAGQADADATGLRPAFRRGDRTVREAFCIQGASPKAWPRRRCEPRPTVRVRSLTRPQSPSTVRGRSSRLHLLQYS